MRTAYFNCHGLVKLVLQISAKEIEGKAGQSGPRYIFYEPGNLKSENCAARS